MTHGEHPQLVALFNHTLTQKQINDAINSLGVASILDLPQELLERWRNIPAKEPAIEPYLEPIRQWLAATLEAGDYLLVQGDFGATYLMVRYAIDKGLIPVYSTTVRDASEELLPDGTVQLAHHFRHVRFRKYGE